MQNRSKSTAVSNTAHQAKVIVMLSMGILIAALIIFASTHANAQNKVKPKLIPIVLNEKTNDPKALEIARKLDPDFFVIDQEYMGGSPDAKFFARYIPLDKNNPKRFIVTTVTNTPFWCTGMGCPFYFYENTKENQWRMVLSWQTHELWYDTNSNHTNPANIVTKNVQSSKNKVNVWMWSVNKYIEVTKR